MDSGGGCFILFGLEFAVSGGACKGDDVADVCHACDEHEEAFKACAKACVRDATEAAKVDVPPVGFFVEPVAFHVFEEDI